MKCEVCRTNYRKIDTLLVCANGHTLQNTTEVAHDDNPLKGRSKRIYKPKKERSAAFKSDGCKLMRMVLMKLLFEELRVHFGIKDDTVFRYFTEFFEFKNAKLDTVFDISKFTLAILVYFAKRSEMERDGRTYLYNDFKDAFNGFDLTNRMVLIKNKYPALEGAINEFAHKYLITSTICSFRPWIDEFSSLYICARRYGFVKSSETGILEESVESARHNIRRLFRNDLELMRAYFRTVCSHLSVESTPELEFYFEKFVYTYDPNVVIFPEYDFTLFIMSYFVSKDAFEGSEIEENVLEYFGVCKTNLITSHYAPFVDRLNQLATPESYVSYMIKKSRCRFENLRGAIEFIDAYKRLVAEDMWNTLLSKMPNGTTVKDFISNRQRKCDERIDSEDEELDMA